MAYSLEHPPARVALGHPAVWIGLVVLAVNDHLLKGAGLLPEWWTGKASDLAGLFVAPVLAAALAAGRRRALRVAAFALPVLVFVAIKVSPGAARALEAAMGAAGLPWRIVPDPTDLVALAVLPWAIRLSATGSLRAARGRPAPPRRGWLERAALIGGAVACVATGAPQDEAAWSTDVFVVNQTGTIDLRIRWVTGTIDCDRAATRIGDVFAREVFDDGITFHLLQGQTLPLDRAAAQGASRFEELAVSSNECDAVLLQAEGMPNTIAFWWREGVHDVPLSVPAGTAPGEGAVVLQRVANDAGQPIGVSTTNGVEATPLVERLEPEECLSEGSGGVFAWSETEQGTGTVRLTSVERGPDGCFALGLSAADAELPTFFFVCVPADAFPFEAGDTIEISHLTAAEQRSLRLMRSGSAGRPRVELLVYSGVSGIETGSLSGQMVDTDCAGDRLACGGFAVPGAFQITSAGAEGTIVTGGVDEVTVGGASVTVMVGRVERIVLAVPDCTPGRDIVGIRGDVLILTEEE